MEQITCKYPGDKDKNCYKYPYGRHEPCCDLIIKQISLQSVGDGRCLKHHRGCHRSFHPCTADTSATAYISAKNTAAHWP